ncbi:MAG: DUF4830 domain-containing protein [Oscillospiraceae bacterium]|nr:DUF4830 domain-containing protein [Candidatus Equicaccousia limihippi]
MFTIILNKKRLICIAAFAVVLVLCVILLSLKPSAVSPASERAKFIQKLGYTLKKGTAEQVKQVVIPENFSDVYENYNHLQRECGYDLTPYKGCTATVYTLTLEGDDLYAHIITYDGKIIGGDIANNRINGSMKGLTKYET